MGKKKDINFEQAVKKLENIVNELEGDEVELEKALKLFEEGIDISQRCNEILNSAEQKIQVLMKKNEEIVEEDYDEQIFKDKLKYNREKKDKNDSNDELPF